jgi:NAD(P)-dependent dehydrogenase (short-subunit alcohol dehydrogenase family)
VTSEGGPAEIGTGEVEPVAWQARYPDLTGKVAVVTGTSSVLNEVTRELCRNGVTPALVVDDRALITSATDYADQLGVASFGIVADPASPDTWQRVAQHIEQRLGPIDIAVVIAPEATRALVITVLMPDMAARRRGVIVEAGADVRALAVPDGVHHRAVTGGGGVSARDLAAAITFCSSDVLTDPQITIALG